MRQTPDQTPGYFEIALSLETYYFVGSLAHWSYPNFVIYSTLSFVVFTSALDRTTEVPKNGPLRPLSAAPVPPFTVPFTRYGREAANAAKYSPRDIGSKELFIFVTPFSFTTH